MDPQPQGPEAPLSRRQEHPPHTNRRQVRAHRRKLRPRPRRRSIDPVRIVITFKIQHTISPNLGYYEKRL